MLTHDAILGRLVDRFPTTDRWPWHRGVALVARLAEAQLRLPPLRALVFVPDLHLATAADAAAYPRTAFAQGAELTALTTALAELKRDHRGELEVVQLGDLADLWRARSGAEPAREGERIRHEQRAVLDPLLLPPASGGARACRIAGNRDAALRFVGERCVPRLLFLPGTGAIGRQLLALHGDGLAWAERAPDQLAERVERLAAWVDAGGDAGDDELVRGVAADVPRDDSPGGIGAAAVRAADPGGRLRRRFNVISAGAVDTSDRRRHGFAAAAALAEALRAQGREVPLVVAAHSHYPRIVRGARPDGAPFVLMDCGAWVGRCRLDPQAPWIASAQIGVVVGTDLRIYQLGWSEVEDQSEEA